MENEHEDKGQFERYELGYHLVPSLGPDDLALRVREFMQVITDGGGSIDQEGAPEAYTLAYTMRRLRGGTYHTYNTSFFGWIRFSAPPESIEALRKMLELDEHVIRHLLFKLDRAALAPAPVSRRDPELMQGKALVKKHEAEEKAEVSEEELDKQLEQLIA